VLEGVCRSIKPEDFEIAVRSMIQAQRILVFGLGPSSAIATYLVLQAQSFRMDAASLTNSGLLFADDLRSLRKGISL
jgi:DNA-binding MurR/RpiR family transcriptional regulator